MAIKEDVLNTLQSVKLPDGSQNVVEAEVLSEIIVHNGKVYFSIHVDASNYQQFEDVRSEAEKCVQQVEGVQSVSVTLTAEQAPGHSKTPPVIPGGKPGQAAQQKGRGPSAQNGIPGVKHIIAVASGKGGVGKSTTSVNLAMGLSALGLKTGILDADIYGPSMPRLLGITGKPTLNSQDKLIPMQSYGVKVMSMGFVVKEDQPMIWRGPMVISALTQMMNDVDWGELDIMVVDMPPGTGDAQLTMAQKVPLSGAVIVSTPQDLALLDARKGLNMFRKVEIPILGIIENMSYFLCPNCNERSDIFGHGGAREEAERLSAQFLGEVPLHMEIREKSDLGEPIVVGSPESEHAKIYKSIAEQVWSSIEENTSVKSRTGPKITIET